jgi:hypothetical protein
VSAPLLCTVGVVIMFYIESHFIRTHESLLSVVCSVVVEKMLSGWLVAMRHLPRNLAHARISHS